LGHNLATESEIKPHMRPGLSSGTTKTMTSFRPHAGEENVMTLEKKLHRSGPYADLFSQGVQVDNTLYLAGQVGMDDSGATPEDLVSQMKLAYQNIQAVLAEFGADMDNIVDETWFVTDVNDCMAQVEALFTERHMIYGKAPEVSQTLVQVVALVDPALKIEIKCVAALG
jgi:enamine deaminase RidA (YjgF/YER057c/UK114 family)